MTNRRSTIWMVVAGLVWLCLLGAVGLVVADRIGLPVPTTVNITVPYMNEAEHERWAREQFFTNHPDEKPLNWAIARTAEEFWQNKPMGDFVLNENDCSDFVGCVVDHALGAGARFERESDEHLLCGPGGAVRRELFVTRLLPDVNAVQPGDIIGVRHSHWYPPRDDSTGHVGVVGPDGRVLDFVKLKVWSEAYYGRSDLAWFIRNCTPDEVRVIRLRADYRYLIADVPGVR